MHERLSAHVQPWQPTISKQLGPSPYHTWYRINAAPGLARPLLLAAVYLPPFNSKYGLRSRQQLEDFFTRLGDEAAEGTARLGGADVCMGGDWNGHLGCIQESGECGTLRHALGEDADEVLVPMASASALPCPFPARASMCSAPVCEQGRSLMQFCSDAGLFVMNGRVPGDELGCPTCFAGNPSLIDLFIGSPGLLAQATCLARTGREVASLCWCLRWSTRARLASALSLAPAPTRALQVGGTGHQQHPQQQPLHPPSRSPTGARKRRGNGRRSPPARASSSNGDGSSSSRPPPSPRQGPGAARRP